MNRKQRESLYRLINLADGTEYQEDVEVLRPLLERRRKRLREILPLQDQTQIPV